MSQSSPKILIFCPNSFIDLCLQEVHSHSYIWLSTLFKEHCMLTKGFTRNKVLISFLKKRRNQFLVFKFSQNIFLKEFNKSKTLHSFLWVINIHFFCMGWTVALRSAIWISYRATVLQLVICIIYTLYPKYLRCFTKFRSAVKEEAYKKKPMTDGLTDRRRLGKKHYIPLNLLHGV